MNSFRPFFIVGSPRSGTTLLAVMLDRHSQICVPPETHFFHTLNPKWSRSNGASHEQLVDECVFGNHLWDLKLDREALISRFQERFCATYPNVYRCALEAYAERHGKIQICEKTATHLEHVSEIIDWYPDAKFLWIVRDGRDVVCSLMNHKWLHNRMRRHAYNWSRLARIGLEFQENLPKQFKRVSFEQLIHSPKNSLTEIMEFLGSEFQQQQLVARQNSGAVLDKEMDHKGRALQPIDRKRIGVWRNNTTKKQATMLNNIMRTELGALGYQAELRQGQSLGESIAALPYRLAYHPKIYKHIQRRMIVIRQKFTRLIEILS